jgi:DNA topoisomerase-3
MANIAAQLETEARGADTLLLWLDCDREGENIAFEVMEVCRKANPRLDVWRARFASIVPREILQAANNPVRPNQLDSEAVDARIELDLRTGAVWTRFLSLRYKQRYAGLEETISYGACQFPTLGFVVHRFNQIESFVPESFWRLVLEMEKDGKTAVFTWERGRVFDQSVCAALYEQCVRGGTASVTHVATKPKSKYRPFPLTTVKLQQLGTGKLRMSGERVMSIAEGLYTRGLISYPRTETDAFAPGTPFPDLIREQHNDPQLGAYAQRMTFREPKRGNKSDQAHTAIHPTKSGAGLQGQERQVRFVACCLLV